MIATMDYVCTCHQTTTNICGQHYPNNYIAYANDGWHSDEEVKLFPKKKQKCYTKRFEEYSKIINPYKKSKSDSIRLLRINER